MKLKHIIITGCAASMAFLASCKEATEAAKDAGNKAADSAKAAVSEKAGELKKEATDMKDKAVADVKEKIEEKKEEIKEAVAGAVDSGSAAMMDKMTGVMGDFAGVLESIKDEDSAKAAFAKMDTISASYGALVKEATKLQADPANTEAMTKMMMEKMVPIQERMQKAGMSASTFLATKPELMAEFQKKMQAFAMSATGQ